MINPDDLTIAREWAGDPGEFYSGAAPLKEVARVIQTLPDEIVSGAEVRELIEELDDEKSTNVIGPDYREGWREALGLAVQELEALLPSPPRKPAMIKRGAIAVHPEHGEVLVISNKSDRQGNVMTAWDDEYSSDGTYYALVHSDELTAPDEEPETATVDLNKYIPAGQVHALLSQQQKQMSADDDEIIRAERKLRRAQEATRSVYDPASWLHDEVAGGTDQAKEDNPEDAPCNEVDEEPDGGNAPERPLANIKIGNWAHHNTHGKVLITANTPNAFGLVRCVIPDDFSRIANLPITDLHREPEAGEGEEERR